MNLKKKVCKSCKKEEFIFSKNRCKRCATMEDSKPLQRSSIKKKAYKMPQQTQKNKDKRKESRAGYGDFFVRHINIILNEHKSCENCGSRLQGIAGEVCHILSKSKSPEVSTNDDNVLYMCLYGSGCHSEFDNTLEKRGKMRVFKKALEKFKILEPILINITSETEQFSKYLTDRNL